MSAASKACEPDLGWHVVPYLWVEVVRHAQGDGYGLNLVVRQVEGEGVSSIQVPVV